MTIAIVGIATITLIAVLSGGALILHQIDWKSRLATPSVLAAVVVAFATVAVAAIGALGGAVSGWIVSSYQASSEIEKTKANVLLSIVQQYDASMVPTRNEEYQRRRMTILIQSGIVSDEKGSICMALIKEGCPIKVLSAK
jgi:hypothetical protein